MFWLGAIVSLCYIPGITGAYIATQWPVLAVMLSFGLLRSGPVTVFHWLGLAFLAFATVHVFFTPMPYASVFGLWLIFIMGLSLWFGTTLSSMNVRDLYVGLAIGGTVSSFLALLQFNGFELLPTTSAVSGASGLYVNSVQQGTVLALIAVALVTERMWPLALPLLPGIVLSNSRGAWLALTVGLLGCRFGRLWVFGAVGAIGAFYLLTPLGASDQIRTLIWSYAWTNLVPLGWGPGVFYGVLFTGHDGVLFYPEHAHNDALQLLFEYGVGALLPFSIFVLALCRTSDREWPVVLAFVTAGCYSMPLWMPIASFLALVAVGRVLRTHALVRAGGYRRGWHVVSWWRDHAAGSRQAVSVAPSNSGKV